MRNRKECITTDKVLPTGSVERKYKCKTISVLSVPLRLTLPDKLATINEVLRASHIARIVRQQQNRLADHLLGLGEAFEGDVRGLVRAHRGVHAGCLCGVDVSGAERVDADPVRRPFGCETFGDGGDGGF